MGGVGVGDLGPERVGRGRRAEVGVLAGVGVAVAVQVVERRRGEAVDRAGDRDAGVVVGDLEAGEPGVAGVGDHVGPGDSVVAARSVTGMNGPAAASVSAPLVDFTMSIAEEAPK